MTNKKLIWTIIRTLGFVLIGLMNTALIRPEDVGSWKYYAGIAFLIIAVADITYIGIVVNRRVNGENTKFSFHILLYPFALIAFIIAVFQFVGGRNWGGGLSVVFCVNFLVGILMQIKNKKALTS